MSDRATSADAEAFDLIVVGAGTGGMTAAVTAARHGLRTLLIEKTDQAGGTTSTSAGTLWIPGSAHARALGLSHDLESADLYLRTLAGDADPRGRRAAFLANGAKAIEWLEANTQLKLAAAALHPDYRITAPGATPAGRALVPLPFDGRTLGSDFDRVRPPKAEFMILGGMMVGKDDIVALLQPFRSWRALRHAITIVGRYALDRLRWRRGTRLMMGNALVGRLYASVREAGVEIRFGTTIERLIVEGDRIAGVVARTPGGERMLRASRGVVLAGGGFHGDRAWCERAGFPSAVRRTVAFAGNTGDLQRAARLVGAAVEEGHESPAFWMPASVMGKGGDAESVYPHIYLDRAKPGLIAVSRNGRRFVDEAINYHDFVLAMLAQGLGTRARPVYLICDRRFLWRYGLGLVHPHAPSVARFIRSGYLTRADSITALAERLAIDPAALAETVERHNRFALSGVDEDFGKGGTAFDRFNGDPEHAPNPCLAPLVTPPFYAVAVEPVDMGPSVGLATDAYARCVDAEGRPIEGLYACGADAASVMRGTYPGPGITLGPALVFGWIAARHAAGQIGQSAEDARPGSAAEAEERPRRTA